MDRHLTLDLLSEDAEHFEAGSVGEWSWWCPCSPSTVIWHMQCFALLQALRHWSKEWALTGPGNNNRNKGTNDFVPTPAWCLPLAHHCLSAYWLRPAFSLFHFFSQLPPSTHPHHSFAHVWQNKSVPSRFRDCPIQLHGPLYCRFQLQYIYWLQVFNNQM